MSITYTTTIQDRIAYKVWGVANATLSAAQKGLLDGTWTSGSLTSGVAYDALTRINQYAQWFNQAGASDAPTAWEQWFVAETALLAANTVRPDRTSIFERERDDAIDTALEAFSLVDASGSTVGGQTITYKGIRGYVMDQCIRRRNVWGKDAEKFRMFVPPQSVDSATQWTINFLWNYTSWRFRKRQVQITITPIEFTTGTWTESSSTLANITTTSYTNVVGMRLYLSSGTGATVGEYSIATKPGSTSLTLSSSLSTSGTDLLIAGDLTGVFYNVSIRGMGPSESIDSMSSRWFNFVGSGEWDSDVLTWATADELARLKAFTKDDVGKPCKFRFERHGSSLAWMFDRYPDAAYTLTGEVFVATPAAASTSTDTAPFTAFPPEFATVIRDVVLAKVLLNANAPGANAVWQKAEEQITALLETYEEHGSSEDDAILRTRDFYGDVAALGDPGMIGGGM